MCSICSVKEMCVCVSGLWWAESLEKEIWEVEL